MKHPVLNNLKNLAITEVKQLKSNRLLLHDACSTDASVRLHCSAGLFNYGFALGIDFAESNQPVGFINFKKFTARHIAAETHQATLVRIILKLCFSYEHFA